MVFGNCIPKINIAAGILKAALWGNIGENSFKFDMQWCLQPTQEYLIDQLIEQDENIKEYHHKTMIMEDTDVVPHSSVNKWDSSMIMSSSSFGFGLDSADMEWINMIKERWR